LYEEKDLSRGASDFHSLLEPGAYDYGGFGDAHDSGERDGGSTGTLLLSCGAFSGEAVPIRDDSPCDNAVR